MYICVHVRRGCFTRDPDKSGLESKRILNVEGALFLARRQQLSFKASCQLLEGNIIINVTSLLNKSSLVVNVFYAKR